MKAPRTDTMEHEGTRDPRSGATSHADLLTSLREGLEAALEPLIPADEPYALLDFPHSPNVGDSAIWIGTLDYLHRRKMPAPRYTSSNLTFSPEHLRRRLPEGTILLSGGGNFGDLYETHQSMRELVVTEFPKHRIVQLPQSIHFTSGRALDRARRAFNAHSNVTILTRDERSHEISRESFEAPGGMCTDMAFCIKPLKRLKRVCDDVIWLSRRDKESAGSPIRELPSRVRRVEWLQDDPTPTLRLNMFLARQLRYRPIFRAGFQGLLSSTYEQVARERLLRGFRILSAGSSVITDRLHGHIMCMLMGIPHFLLDNSYGKVRGFYDAWTYSTPLARWCASEKDALRLATLGVERGAQPR